MKKILFSILAVIFSNCYSHAQCQLNCNQNVTVIYQQNSIIHATDLTDGLLTGCGEILLSFVNPSTMVPYLGPDTSLTMDCSLVGSHVFILQDTQSGSTCMGNLSINDITNQCTPSNFFTVYLDSDGRNKDYAQNVFLNGHPLNKVGIGTYELPKDSIQATGNTFTFEEINPIVGSGITTLDMVLLMRQLAEIAPLNTQQIIAADFDTSNYLGVFDVVKMQRHILGIENGASFRFIHYSNLFVTDPFDFGHDVYTYTFDAADTSNISFIFKVVLGGDVNLNYNFRQNDDDKPNRSTISLQYPEKFLTTGEEYVIPLSVPSQKIAAILASLRFTDVQLIETMHNYQGENYLDFIDGNTLNLVYATAKEHDFFNVSVRIKALKDGYLSQFLTLNPDFPVECLDVNLNFNSLTLTEAQTTATIDLASDIHVMPNPANDQLHVVAQGSKYPSNLMIVNAMGQVVASKATNQQRVTFDVSHLPDGIYILISNNGEVLKEKVYIMH